MSFRQLPRLPGSLHESALLTRLSLSVTIAVSLPLPFALLALAADGLFGALQRALTPRALRDKVPAFEPDVMSDGTAGAP